MAWACTCGSSTATVWTLWNNCTSATNETATTWGVWCSSGTASSTAWNVWVSWNEEGTASTTTYCPRQYGFPAETDKQRAERLVREADARARLEEEAKKAEEARKAAEKRSEELLVGMLSKGQREQYQKSRSFTVVTESGKRYQVRRGWAGNVDEIDEQGRAVARYCIHPSIGVPHPDNMLAQKLMLETNEHEFLRIANRSTPYPAVA